MPRSIKDKLTKALDKTQEGIKKAAIINLSIAGELASKASNAVLQSNLNAKAKSVLARTLDSTTSATREAREQIENPKPRTIMNHKILMMGGRRAGKSTILSSILSSLKETPGAICTVLDKTDYTSIIGFNKDTGEPIKIPTLAIKQNEVRAYIRKRQQGGSPIFTVDMTQTLEHASYLLEVSAQRTAVEFEFVDVPGEWMRATNDDHARLKEEVKTSDVFVIAIDTPFLMHDDDISNVYNRVTEICNIMSEMRIDNELDKKLIILCPVKCEKWIRAGKADLVVKKVRRAYRDLINRWVAKPEVAIQIMPIQTVGGIESDSLLPALLYFEDDDDPSGTSCSPVPGMDNLYIDKNGKFLLQRPTSRVEEDPSWTRDFVNIPLSWYKLNGAGYTPVHCEQVGYHILRFLVTKEDHIEQKKANDRGSFLPSWLKGWIQKFIPTFGHSLPIWKGVIEQLNQKQLIKDCGDGFEVVTELID